MAVESPTQPVTADRRGWILWSGLACVLLLIAWIAYSAGRQHDGSRTLTGHGRVGIGVATVEAEGWFYGINLDSVTWTDEQGGSHSGEAPACLDHVGDATIRFSETPVKTPDGDGWREVFWVDCRGSYYTST